MSFFTRKLHFEILAARAVASFSETGDNGDAPFLSAISEAQADGMRRISQDGDIIGKPLSRPARKTAAAPKRSQIEPEGEYMAALRWTHSDTWQAFCSKMKSRYGVAASHSTSANLGGDGTGGQGNSTDGCFHCGKDGHWSRDCPSRATMTPSSWGPDGFNVPGHAAQVPQRPCPCGGGTCLVLAANTGKNAGRQFYRCPLRKESGQCGFFEWCDGITSSSQGPSPKDRVACHKHAEFPCPCGAGPCLILTAKTEKNMGRQFYRCPHNQGEGSCGFFKWCDESAPASSTSGTAHGGSFVR